jgi:hypothetical protein
VWVDRGRTLQTHGPFAETKEVFGGFYVVDVDGIEEALEFAARVSAARWAARWRSGRLLTSMPEPDPFAATVPFSWGCSS